MIKIPNLSKIRLLLSRRKQNFERKLQQVVQEDPFLDKTRLLDNASSDTEAREEVGHERVEVLKNELLRNLALVKKALSRLGVGKYGTCEDCGKPINKARLEVFPEAVFCIECEQKKEAA